MRFGILILCSSLALIGCQTGPSLVGSWNVTVPSMTQAGGTATATFGSPDKVTMEFNLEGGAQTAALGFPQGAKIKGTVNGTYKLQGEKLTVTVGDVQVSKEGLDSLGAQQWAVIQGYIKTTIEDEAKGFSEAKVTWEGDDKFTAETARSVATFSRSS